VARTIRICDQRVLTEIAYAKINLALHVRRRRDDGYHDLETVFAFCEDGDVLEAEQVGADAAGELIGDVGSSRLEVDGPFADKVGPVARNAVIKAFQWLDPRMTVHFRLTKNLPVASGIGGGSADGAAALRLVHRLLASDTQAFYFQAGAATSEWRYGEATHEARIIGFDDVGFALGADVPGCIHSKTARGEGIGEKLALLGQAVAGTPILLVNPGVALSTATVFAAWDGIDRGLLADWRQGRNDLEEPACELVPEISYLLQWLRGRRDVTLARMSGSGATCFALFSSEDARARAARETTAAFPGHWIMESRLR
jgi:4-diphosphocytidyl-2-C-methyl-D-erythritol kinase